jgi:hypothetical protein
MGQKADLALQISQAAQLDLGIRTFEEFPAKHLETLGDRRDLLEKITPQPASKLGRAFTAAQRP